MLPGDNAIFHDKDVHSFFRCATACHPLPCAPRGGTVGRVAYKHAREGVCPVHLDPSHGLTPIGFGPQNAVHGVTSTRYPLIPGRVKKAVAHPRSVDPDFDLLRGKRGNGGQQGVHDEQPIERVAEWREFVQRCASPPPKTTIVRHVDRSSLCGMYPISRRCDPLPSLQPLPLHRPIRIPIHRKGKQKRPVAQTLMLEGKLSPRLVVWVGESGDRKPETGVRCGLSDEPQSR